MPPSIIEVKVWSIILNASLFLASKLYFDKKIMLCGLGNFGASPKPPYFSSKKSFRLSKISVISSCLIKLSGIVGLDTFFNELTMLAADFRTSSLFVFHAASTLGNKSNNPTRPFLLTLGK